MSEPKSRRSREKAWVSSLVPRLQSVLGEDETLDVCDGFRLPYRNEIHSYKGEGIEIGRPNVKGYQTDLLISEIIRGGWIPRVVIECKIGGVTTHDALTYSAKAATHKHVHPYLRYGILIGALGCVPSRLIHHGTQFDFMAAWPEETATAEEWQAFVAVLKDEVQASRLLGELMQNRSHKLIHRPLRLPLAHSHP